MSFFGMFNYGKEGPGISADAPKKRGFFRFFDILANKFSKLLGLNLLYTVCSLPAFLAYFFLSSFIVPNFIPQGESFALEITLLSALIAVLLIQTLGGGIASPGLAYIIRSFVREQPAFMLSDFFQQIKDNLKQSIVVFLIDSALTFLIFFNINFFTVLPNALGSFTYVFKIFTLIFVVLYMMARMYLYQLMVTYKASLLRIYKYSFLLCMYKLPQNLLIFVITLALYYFASLLPITVFILFVAPLVLFTVTSLIQTVYTDAVIEQVIVPDGDVKKSERIFED